MGEAEKRPFREGMRNFSELDKGATE